MEHDSKVNEPANNKGKSFEPGMVYFNSYKPPGKAPKGYCWFVDGYSEGDRGYPVTWKLGSNNPEPPGMDELPPINPKSGKPIEEYQPELPGIDDSTK